MKQLTLAAVSATPRRRAHAFLAEMERVVLWSALCAVVEPFYPKPLKRPFTPLPSMLGQGRVQP